MLKAHRLCVSPNSGLENNKEEEERVAYRISVQVSVTGVWASKITRRHSMDYESFGLPNFDGTVSEFTPRKALELIVWRQVDF